MPRSRFLIVALIAIALVLIGAVINIVVLKQKDIVLEQKELVLEQKDIVLEQKLELIQTPQSNDSPGEVVGGSMYLQWKSGYPPENPCPEFPGMICGHSDDPRLLDFDNLGGKKNVLAANGWMFSISNRDKDDVEQQNAVRVCSDPDCSGSSVRDPKTFYVKLRPGVIVDGTTGTSNRMYFHDSNCKGQDPLHCDKAVNFTFDIGGIMGSDKKACDNSNSKKCIVFIGTRK
jgi:hypothetical protein